ncbi:MAG TPA: TIGR00159 family protein [Candidatus Faeciplasma avium]|uniref:Diadenylate cyclase n=1 Tax=Candidatus Faeciplasma avium TaxID=2840798 RepID=A0A9D1NPX2_9FIRM|nr:TIGR00159 family protein [Candidatus Faeciplasma avium]
MDYINDIITRLSSIISTITFLDAIDILLLTFFIYKGIKLIRETKAQQLLTGILVVIAVYFISAGLELRVMSYLLSNFLQVGIIAILIVFQPELRRMLEKVGRTNVKSIGVFSDSVRSDDMIQNWNRTIEVVGEAASQLSESTTGALIVIERQTRLGEQIDTGTVMDCVPSVASLGTIFFPKTPLHDGAVIIRNARIIAAGCFLPTPQKEERINKLLGSRHRAAIGMSENSDAIIVVVSEETGTISIAENGELTRGYTKDRLIKYLKSQIIPEKPQAEKRLFSRLLPRKEKKNATEEKED